MTCSAAYDTVPAMFGWTFHARSFDEVSRLLRAMGKHRYVREVDHRIHWVVDEVLKDHDGFREQAASFELRAAEGRLDRRSRDPRLWRTAPIDQVLRALELFWLSEEARDGLHERLRNAIRALELPISEHEAFESSAEDPPHPELILLDWEFLPVDELDAERHQGALHAMSEAEEEASASARIYVEGPAIGVPELCLKIEGANVDRDLMFWSDGPYSYSDYVFLGVAKSAKLAELPVGYHDAEDGQ